MVESHLPRLLKVLEIICEKGDWLITRLFEDCKQARPGLPFGVWLCRRHQWECFILDDKIQIDK